MESGVLNRIGFRPNIGFLTRKLHIKEDSRFYPELERIVAEACEIARPKAAFRIGYIENKEEDAVVINQIRFTSHVLRVNLGSVHRVFFYLATCGEELEAWSKQMPDMVYQYWADAIRESALRAASRALTEYLKEHYQLSKTSAMGPGSLEDWPITQQRLLFDAMEGLDKQIGVKLTDSFLMVPVKSISGIRFPSENRFESCQLCPRENCIGRRASYDRELYAKRFA